VSLDADFAVHRDSFVVEMRLQVRDGETMALVGPNGAGKSTVIEAIAGLLPLDRGSIRVDAEPIERRPPDQRPIGVVFQDGLLFPHLSALDNVAFPQRAGGASKGASRTHAAELLAALAPEVRGSARPRHLSGGERQRVALARAVGAGPRVLLLDEPLSAVDVSARAALRTLLRDIIGSFAGACVLVAHDPFDALTLADRVAILEGGRIVQTGTADDIRAAPATTYAADLVGMNLFRGRFERDAGGGGRLLTATGDIVVAWPEGISGPVEDAVAVIRPADVSIHLNRPQGSPRNVVHGGIIEIAYLGDRARLRIASRPGLVAEITQHSLNRLGLAEGRHVFASYKAVDVQVRVSPARPGTLVG
jgi:molybdate transport system ATP-binding protein